MVPFLYKMKKDWWIKYAKTFVTPFVFGLLWLPTLLVQLDAGRSLMNSLPAWRNIIGGSNVKQLVLVWNKFVFGRISLLNKTLYYLLVVLASIPSAGAILISFRNRNKKIDLIGLWLIIPLGLGFITSFLFPAFNYFRYVYVLPAFFLMVAWGAVSIKGVRIRNTIIGLLIAFNMLSIGIYAYDSNQHRETWRQATEFIEENSKELDVSVFAYPRPFTPFRWYSSGKTQAYGVTDAVASDEKLTKQKTIKAIRGKDGVYYFEYLSDLSDPGGVIRSTLEHEGYMVSEVFNFHGVGQVFYFTK
jgi:hypothetical protein